MDAGLFHPCFFAFLAISISIFNVFKLFFQIIIIIIIISFTVTSTEGLTATCAAAFELS